MPERMQLQPWSYRVSGGFVVRGMHSRPTGRPVLHFLHGNGYCGMVYRALLEPLSEHFDLFLSDVQGHGDSDHGGRFRGWNRTADYCVEAWQHHAALWRGQPVYALGHSFGGVITSLVMAQHPELFRRAVLLDPVLFTPAMIGVMGLSDVTGLSRLNVLANRARRRRSHWPDARSAFDSLHGRGIFRGWEDRCLWDYVHHALRPVDDGLALKCRPSREADIFGSFPRRLWRSLARVQTPTVLLHGTRTYPFVRKSAARFAATNGNVRVERFGGGHCFMMVRPDATADRVLAALTEGGEAGLHAVA
jgi:pimeloyl-ACP methyl ester carboxylesterase